MFLCWSFSVIPLRQILYRWVHPCLFMGLNTSSCGRNRYNRIKLPHDLPAPCNSCLLVVLENQPPVHFWLVDELTKLQSYLELCRFTQTLLQPRIARWETSFPLELAWESDHGTRLNGWCITRGTQPKGRMSCLEFWYYDWSHSNLKHIVFLRPDGNEQYLIHPQFAQYDLVLLVCVQRRSNTLLASCIVKLYPSVTLCTDYSGVSSSQLNGIIRRFLNSPSCHNLRTRFLLREEGCNTRVTKTLIKVP
jgi:hypothetical protein